MTRILLADDHPMIRTALEVLLRDTRYELAGTAGTGVEALTRGRAAGAGHPAARPGDAGGRRNGCLAPLRARDKSPSNVILLTAAIDDSSLLEAKRAEGRMAWCSRIRIRPICSIASIMFATAEPGSIPS